MAKTLRSEASLLKAVCDLLTAKRVFWLRMNVGAVKATYGGKTRFVRFGKPGMADILAWFPRECGCGCGGFSPYLVWLEIKTPTGKQSEAQQDFEKAVDDEGMDYWLVRDIDDFTQWLKARLR